MLLQLPLKSSFTSFELLDFFSFNMRLSVLSDIFVLTRFLRFILLQIQYIYQMLHTAFSKSGHGTRRVMEKL